MRRPRTRRLLQARWLVAAATLVVLGCGGTTTGVTPDAASAADGPDAATLTDGRDGGGEDAACAATLVFAPLAFRGLLPADPVGCGVAFPAVQQVRIWVFRRGALIRDETLPCSEPLRLAGLEADEYEVAALGFVDGISAGFAGPWPWFALGGRLLADVYEGPVGSCTLDSLVCNPLVVAARSCGEHQVPLELYCWKGVNRVVDGCGL